MSACEQDSADDSRVKNDSLHGMQANILNAVRVESEALRVEVKQMQRDILRILSKLPVDSSEKDLPETGNAGGRLGALKSSATAWPATKHACPDGSAAARPTFVASPSVASSGVSNGTAASEAPSSRRSPGAALSQVASPPARRARDAAGPEESMPRITADFGAQVEYMSDFSRGVSGESHSEGRPSSTRLGRPVLTAGTSRRYRSIVPAVDQEPKDFSSLRRTFSGEVATAARSEAAKMKGSVAESFFTFGDGMEEHASSTSQEPEAFSSIGRTFSGEVAKMRAAVHESFHTFGDGMEEHASSTSQERQGEPSQEEPGRAAGAPPGGGIALCAARPAGERCGGCIEDSLMRLCGMLPWSVTRKWSTWLYQRLLAVVATMVTIGLIGVLVAEIVDGEANLATILEALLALGSSLGLWSCQVHRSSKSLIQAQEALSNRMSSSGPKPKTGQAHVVLSLLMWIATVGIHIGADASDDVSVSTPQKLGFAVVSFLHTALVSMIVYKCNCIRAILATFCDNVVDGKDFPRAVHEWHCVRDCCQHVCKAVEACFVVMVTISAIGVLIVALRMSSEDVSLRVVPALLLTLVSFRILFFAAAVTKGCTHVPVLVNSVGIEKTLDPTRMYAVQYMRYCQSGFCAFGMFVTPSGVGKFAYFGCAVAFTILTQHNPGNPFVHWSGQ